MATFGKWCPVDVVCGFWDAAGNAARPQSGVRVRRLGVTGTDHKRLRLCRHSLLVQCTRTSAGVLLKRTGTCVALRHSDCHCVALGPEMAA